MTRLLTRLPPVQTEAVYRAVGYERIADNGGDHVPAQVEPSPCSRYSLRMILLRPRVDELLPVPAVAPRPPFVHVPA